MVRSEQQLPMLVDSHVHIHSCFDVDALLDSAVDNFRRVGGPRATGVDGGSPWGV